MIKWFWYLIQLKHKLWHSPHIITRVNQFSPTSSSSSFNLPPYQLLPKLQTITRWVLSKWLIKAGDWLGGHQEKSAPESIGHSEEYLYHSRLAESANQVNLSLIIRHLVDQKQVDYYWEGLDCHWFDYWECRNSWNY